MLYFLYEVVKVLCKTIITKKGLYNNQLANLIDAHLEKYKRALLTVLF